MQQINRVREIRWLYAILFLSVSLLLVAILFTFRTFNDTRLSFNRIEKNDSLICAATAFESYIFRTESNVRLAIITNSTEIPVLDRYFGDGKEQLVQIARLTYNYSSLCEVDSLDDLLADRFALWYRIQELLKDTSGDHYLATSLAVNSSHVTGRMDRLIKDIIKTERRTLQTSIDTTRKGIMVISGVLTTATLFSLIFIFFVFRRLHVEIKKEMLVQETLHQKIRELDRSNTHLERFAYTASHDLQEPLRKLHAFSDKLALQEKDRLSADGKDIINRMQKFVDRMQKLIDDLLLFSRILSYKLLKAPVDLNRVLNDVKQNISENILHTETIINSGPLPQIMGYESQLQQLFQNLISNSIRYAKKDVPPVIIIKASIIAGDKISGIKPGDELRKFNMIVFSDNGIGFENKYADRIFEIFQRLHGKSEYEGTGIGLSICKLVAENHDGYIKADGLEGVGTNFMVYFPVL